MTDPYQQGAEFWGQFVPEDKRQQFVSFLADLWSIDQGILYCDYDPDSRLLEALKHVDIDCHGFAFSADDISFPRKTGTQVINGACRVKLGYGQPWTPIEQIPKEG